MLDRMNKYSAQETADAVGVIAETVETMIGLVAEFLEKADRRSADRFEAIWRGTHWNDSEFVSTLYKLERDLTPPDDYDPADRELMGDR